MFYKMERTVAERGIEFDEKRFTKIDVIKTRNTNVFVLNFLPKQEMKQHAHPEKDLSLHVLEGSGTLFIDDEQFTIQKGDIIYCEAHEEVGFLNGENGKTSIYGVLSNIPSE